MRGSHIHKTSAFSFYLGYLFQKSFKLVSRIRMVAKKGFQSRKRGRPRVHPKITKISFLKYFAFGGLFSTVFLFIPVFSYSVIKDLPSPELIKEISYKCTKILDTKGRLLYEVCPDKRAEPIQLSNVSKNVIDATLAIEDSGFYNHKGFRISSIARAGYETYFKDNMQGGSTITQQLVKLTLLTPERTYTRKLKELILSLLVEKLYTKDQILEMYLNLAPYTGNVVGIEAASKRLFGKSAAGLSLAESAMLAGLPSAPSIFSPYKSWQLAKDRQLVVLNRMVTLGMLSKEEADLAFTEELVLQEQKDFIRAPHFVEYVRGLLEEQYGKHYANFGGLSVATSLDLDLQEKAQQIVLEEVEKNKKLNISNGASVVIEPSSGEILVMVGSKDYFSDDIDGKFNASLAFRQPGSSIKPVTYALAVEKGITASSLISDNKTVFKNAYETYTPVNYDGRYHGNISLRTALANSYNVAAVNLLSKVGADNMVGLAKNMGLSSWEADGTYGLSVTLGGKETRLLDLTNLYGTFARGGLFRETRAIKSVKDKNGYEIFSYRQKEQRALSEEASYIIYSILSDNTARLPAFGVNNFLSISGHRVAVKTGTTDLKRDNYTVGFTPRFVVGVWVGNNDNKPMNQSLASGLTGAAPIWNRIMAVLLEGKTDTQPSMPSNVVVAKTCGGKEELYIKGTQPKKSDCEEKDRLAKPESGEGSRKPSER